ncbi:MAG: hypothetical protein KatS3mg076_1219 [Candidatus Binatia bacterium]|nr:MAG: hypothetical protein KatS3mg076_1219 [Candidatus Binatia bacterium]
MNRVKKHDLPKERVAARLRRMGLTVRSQPVGAGFDFLVNGSVRVALKVALPHKTLHRVVSRGRKYSYRYRTWHFNFHRHGRLDKKYADFIVCVAQNKRGRKGGEYFVIPWEAITGKTFALHDSTSRTYVGRYATFRNAWHLIAEAARNAGKVAA